MMEMDGDGVDCENFQRKARALERYHAVITNLEKHAVKLLSDNDNSLFQQSHNAHAICLVKTRTRSI